MRFYFGLKWFFSYTPLMPKIISHTPKKIHQISLDPTNIVMTITCQSGLESLVRRESERLGLESTTGQDRLVSGKWNLSTLYALLIGSRFANRVHIEVFSGKITDFDTLHDTLSDISWSDYLTGKERIVIEASSTRSVLSSTPTIQSVSQKAIFSTLHTPNYTSGIEVHILILIVDDIAHIMLDVTWDPLHKRWYRTESGEAPIKENLAAALVAFANWKYSEPLSDPFCGSGTIAIEAAMMARNIAPWLERSFRIESLPFHDKDEYTSVKNTLRLKAYPSGKYHILASDRDPHMIEIARRNADRAWVADDITFEVKDFLNPIEKSDGQWDAFGMTEIKEQPLTTVTNPPYGKRLENESLDEIHMKLIHTIEAWKWWFITNFWVDIRHWLANKKLLNGSEECRFWYKK